jgi:hypothetical protein
MRLPFESCFAYNFIKIQRALRMKSAIVTGVTDRLRGVADLVALWGSLRRTVKDAA